MDKGCKEKAVTLRLRSRSVLMLREYYCELEQMKIYTDRLCGLVIRVLGYRSGGLGSIPGTTRKKSSGSGTGSTQPREYN
jgi:hypothetical protein